MHATRISKFFMKWEMRMCPISEFSINHRHHKSTIWSSKRSNYFHIRWFQIEVKDLSIFFNTRWSYRFGNHHNATLNDPSDKYLGHTFVVLFGNFSQLGFIDQHRFSSGSPWTIWGSQRTVGS